jgi:AcrR family transcriptional regulator
VAGTIVVRHPGFLAVGPARARLLNAAVEAVGERGYVATTVADVVRRARVSRGTFYAEFASKEECFGEAFLLGCEVFEARLARAVLSAADWSEGVRFATRAYLRGLAEDRCWARVYLLEAWHVPDLRDAAAGRLAERYRAGLARAGLPVPDGEVLYLLAIGTAETAARALREGRDLAALEEPLADAALRVAVPVDGL